MRLVPVSAEDYVEAVKNTELIESKVNLKDVQIGDKVLLQNTLVGTYMGVISLYGPLESSYRDYFSLHSYLRRQVIEVHPGKYHYQTDLKILKVVEKTATPLTKEDSVIKMNNEIAQGKAYFTTDTNFNNTSYMYHRYGYISMASIFSVVPKMTFEEIDRSEAILLFDQSYLLSNSGMLLLQNTLNKKFILDIPYSLYNKQSPPDIFNVHEIICDLKPTTKLQTIKNTPSIYNRQTKPTLTLDNFEKFYKIMKNVKTDKYL